MLAKESSAKECYGCQKTFTDAAADKNVSYMFVSKGKLNNHCSGGRTMQESVACMYGTIRTFPTKSQLAFQPIGTVFILQENRGH